MLNARLLGNTYWSIPPVIPAYGYSSCRPLPLQGVGGQYTERLWPISLFLCTFSFQQSPEKKCQLTQPPHPQSPRWAGLSSPACQARHVTGAAHGLLTAPSPILRGRVSPRVSVDTPQTSTAHLSCSLSLRSLQPQMTIWEARTCDMQCADTRQRY